MGQDFASAWMPEETVQTPREKGVDPSATSDHRTYALLMHLSLIALHFIPFALVIGALVMWQIKKGESSFIDDHGREVVNFQLSLLIYSLALTALTVATCGFGAIGFIPLYILAVVGMIMGGVAASKGEFFRYPATMRLI